MAQQQSTRLSGARVREMAELRSALEISRISNQRLKEELQSLKADLIKVESELSATHIAVGHDLNGRINSEKYIQEAKEKLEVALEIGYIGIWEWNLRTNEVTWDNRMENMFGIKPGKFDGTHLAFQNSINDEDLTHFRNALNLTMRSDMPFETIIRTKPETGAVKYIFIRAILRKDEKDRPVHLQGVCFDVTSMRRGTEQALMKLNEELLRSNKELKQFAYVASHDLQEPLRMVSSFTQMLAHRYGDKLDDNAREYIRFAVEGSTRMYDLLNGLLAYSRVQTRGQEFTKVRMNSVLEKVIQNLNLKITEKNAIVNIRKLPVIHADESQMIQLFQNLIENSIKFSTTRPKITVSSNSDNDYYVFTVKDEGIGIDPQYFEKIFKIFQRLHTKEEYEGTGIGLAICKRIVEQHGGTIRVESEEGKGAAFIFSIARTGTENI